MFDSCFGKYEEIITNPPIIAEIIKLLRKYAISKYIDRIPHTLNNTPKELLEKYKNMPDICKIIESNSIINP